MAPDILHPLIKAVHALESGALHNIASQQQILMRAAASSRSLRRDLMPPLIRAISHKTRGPRLEEKRTITIT